MKILSNSKLKEVIIFVIIVIPILFLLIEHSIKSIDISFLIIALLIITLSFFLLPKQTFFIFIGGSILFYHPFLLDKILYLGKAKVYAQDILMVSMNIYIVVKIFLAKKKIFILSSTKVFIIFFFWGILSMIRGYPNFGFSAIGEARWYILIIFYYIFIILSFTEKKTISQFIKVVAFFIPIMLIIRFSQFYFFDINTDTLGRTAFRFANATEILLAAFLLEFIFLFYINKLTRKFFLLYYFLFFILITLIVIDQTRSVWLATFGGLLAIYFLSNKISIKNILPLVLTGIILVVSLSFISKYVGANISNSLMTSSTFLNNPEQDNTGAWRLIAWSQELETIQKNVIFGEGLGGYSNLIINGKELRVMAHNGYLMNMAKFGSIGQILLFLGLFYWFKEMNRYANNENEKRYKFIAKGLEIALFMHLIYTTFYDFTMFFWIILGLGSALVIIAENKKKRIEFAN